VPAIVPMRMLPFPPPPEPVLPALEPPLALLAGVAPGLDPPPLLLLEPQPAARPSAAIAVRHAAAERPRAGVRPAAAERPRTTPRCAAVRDRNPFLSIPSSSLLCVGADQARTRASSSRPSG
jgi:hypothetical protein